MTKNSMKSITKALADTQTRLTAVRDEIAARRAEKLSVERDVCSRAEAKERAERVVADLAHDAEVATAGRLFGPEAAFDADDVKSWYRNDLGRVVALFAASNPNLMVSLLLDRYPANAEGLDADARAQRLAELDKQIMDLWIEEERLCRAVEGVAAGTVVQRCDWALPAVILAPDEELAA